MGHLVMSEKERLRKAIFEMVKLGHLTLLQAAQQAEISYRQAKRLYKRYKHEGDDGLLNKNRGRISNHRHPYREEILLRYKEKYRGEK